MINIFSPIKIKKTLFKNRIAMSPMCQYSADESGNPNNWHFNHWKTRAIGEIGLVMSEATAIRPDGKLTPNDLGLFNSKQQKLFSKGIKEIHNLGSKFGIQLVHCGRKSWGRTKGFGKYKLVSSSPIKFDEMWCEPKELDKREIDIIVNDFVFSTKLAIDAGADLVEIHAAHGYLIHQFLSPLSNKRKDEYGGSIRNRSRILIRIIEEIRRRVSNDIIIFVRLSCTDWAPKNGFNLKQATETAKLIKRAGGDLIDCSSGGTLPITNPPLRQGYQLRFASHIKNKIKIRTAGVGLLKDPIFINKYIENEKIDFAFLGRELLRNPYWMFGAAKEMEKREVIPVQYQRAY